MLRLTWRFAISLVRRHLAGHHEVIVPFDEGRARIAADLRTALGLGLYRRGHWSPELAVVSGLLRRGEGFVDGGANIGIFTLVAASRVGPAGRVISFEPAALTRAALTRNVTLNQMSWVTIRGEALDSTGGEREFITFTGDAAGLSSFSPARAVGKREWVPTTTLDSALRGEPGPRAALVKLDLEGAEYDALRGAEWLLREVRPRVVLEVDESHLRRQGRSARELMSLLDEADYRVRVIAHDDSAAGYRLRERFEIGLTTVNVLATPRERPE